MSAIVINTASKVHVYDTEYFVRLLAGEAVEPLPQDVLAVILKDFLLSNTDMAAELEVQLAQLLDAEDKPVTIPQGMMVTEEGIIYDFVTNSNIVRVYIQDGRVIIEV